MLPGKYQIKVTSYGHSVPVFNNYAWPSSGIVQVCICLAIPILHSCSLTRSLTPDDSTAESEAHQGCTLASFCVPASESWLPLPPPPPPPPPHPLVCEEALTYLRLDIVYLAVLDMPRSGCCLFTTLQIHISALLLYSTCSRVNRGGIPSSSIVLGLTYFPF